MPEAVGTHFLWEFAGFSLPIVIVVALGTEAADVGVEGRGYRLLEANLHTAADEGSDLEVGQGPQEVTQVGNVYLFRRAVGGKVSLVIGRSFANIFSFAVRASVPCIPLRLATARSIIACS